MQRQEQQETWSFRSIIDIRRGLVVRISAFHAGGPGSIPGVGIHFFLPVLFMSGCSLNKIDNSLRQVLFSRK